MKKLIFLFATTIASLSSCSSDDDKDENGNGGGGSKLPKSEVTTAEPSGSISKLDYTYDGTKIKTTSTSNSNKTVYSYNGDVLAKTEIQVNDITKSYTEYTFDKGDVKTETNYSVGTDKVVTKISSTKYTYDEAAKTQTVEVTDYPGGVPTVSKSTTVNTFDGNNLVKSVTTNVVDDKNDTVTTVTYAYDSKTNYLTNVTGRPATIVKGKNNPVTVNTTVVVRNNNVSGTPTTTQSTYSYEYDAADFPTSAKYFNGGVFTSSKVIFYN